MNRVSADRDWLTAAIELSRRCAPVGTAFSVGAIIVSGQGRVLSEAYSRERDPREHAEEAALAKLDRDQPDLGEATLYSSMEPCSIRASRTSSCTDLILAASIGRVVIALREPPRFVTGQGAQALRAHGVDVIEFDEFAPLVWEINAHLLGNRADGHSDGNATPNARPAAGNGAPRSE